MNKSPVTKLINKSIAKKVFAIIGIIITLLHMTFYFLKPYDTTLFFIGFAFIYCIFIYIPKKINWFDF